MKSPGLSRSETVFKSSILEWEYITNLLKLSRLLTGRRPAPPFFAERKRFLFIYLASPN